MKILPAASKYLESLPSLDALPAALQIFDLRPESPIKRPKPKPKEVRAIAADNAAPVDAIAPDLGDDFDKGSFEDALEAIKDEDRGESDSGAGEANAANAGNAVGQLERDRALH